MSEKTARRIRKAVHREQRAIVRTAWKLPLIKRIRIAWGIIVRREV